MPSNIFYIKLEIEIAIEMEGDWDTDVKQILATNGTKLEFKFEKKNIDDLGPDPRGIQNGFLMLTNIGV